MSHSHRAVIGSAAAELVDDRCGLPRTPKMGPMNEPLGQVGSAAALICDRAPWAAVDPSSAVAFRDVHTTGPGWSSRYSNWVADQPGCAMSELTGDPAA